MSDSLVSFLRARLDEDARIAADARDNLDERWVTDISGVDPTWGDNAYPFLIRSTMHGKPLNSVAQVASLGKTAEPRLEHIARHDPARVLAEVAAKRQLVDFLGATVGGDYIDDGEPEIAARALGFLALPYADHPDYQGSWKP